MEKNRAFTLIELLVVIAVIAVLMGILMPVLSRVREQARMISCASNQKQLIMGLVGYATENDDNLPPSPVKLGKLESRTSGYHHPMELNMHWTNGWGEVADVRDRNYTFVGKFLSSYLPDVDVFNCPVAPVKASDPWPPHGSGWNPFSTYGELYKSGVWAPLHCTYMLLWNYQGWNDLLNPQAPVSAEYTRFIGSTKASSKVKLVVQDAMMFKTNSGVLFPGAQIGWYSSHNIKNSIRSKGCPFYMKADKDRRNTPNVSLNAGYLDGHVSRYRAIEGVRVSTAAHEAVICREFR